MNARQSQPKPAKREERISLVLLALVVWLAKRERAKSLAQGDWLFLVYL